MPITTVSCAATRIEAEPDAGSGTRLVVGAVDGRSIIRELRAELPLGLRQLRADAPGETCVRVAVVQTGAMLVGGDDVALNVSVQRGAALVLQDISATLVHPGADARQRISLDIDGVLVFREEPVVVARGAMLDRTVSVRLSDVGRIVLGETAVLGRHGEAGGALCSRTRVTRDGFPLLDDGLDTAASATSRAVLGDARVIAAVSAFGLDVDLPPDGFALDRDGVLVRRLGATVREHASLGVLLDDWERVALRGRRP